MRAIPSADFRSSDTLEREESAYIRVRTGRLRRTLNLHVPKEVFALLFRAIESILVFILVR
jgi:hypothetical protein